MAEVRPFRGLRYNQEVVRDLGEVVCPPYDVISPEYQKVLYERSPYNIIRVEHGLALPEDAAENNRHTRAAATLSEWCEKGILRFDIQPSIYLHDQFFGTMNHLRRRGLMARVRLEPPEKRAVLPHENTVPGIRSDRLALLRACQANISPIMVLYLDRSGETAEILEQASKTRPVADFTVPDGGRHCLWTMTDNTLLSRLSRLFATQTLYIADGHHRYETSLAYQQERRAQTLSGTGQEGFNFIMMTLIPFDDPGLVIHPIHRVINGLTPAAVGKLKGQFERIFDVRYLAVETVKDSAGLLRETGGLFLVAGLVPEKVAVCYLRGDFDIDRAMPAGRSPAYKRLPVSLLHHLVLDRLPEYSGEQGSIAYIHDEIEAEQVVRKGDSSVTVLMPPIDPLTIKAVADAGDRMPGKSTFFYPKLPTGLVINHLEV
ncbi:MAG: DUF1015 domain-containing protein [Dehalococcoidia bacterium]|nr:DUF1015 domain-containing protein [Dehalococcoidia bacterium]